MLWLLYFLIKTFLLTYFYTVMWSKIHKIIFNCNNNNDIPRNNKTFHFTFRQLKLQSFQMKIEVLCHGNKYSHWKC